MPLNGGIETRVCYGERGREAATRAPQFLTCVHTLCMLQGGLYANKPGEQPPSLKARRAAAKALSTSGNSIFRSFTSVCGRGEGGDASAASPGCVVWEGIHALMKCQHSPLASDGGTPPLPSPPLPPSLPFYGATLPLPHSPSSSPRSS